MGKKGGLTPIGNGHQEKKVMTLMDAISNIQQFAAVEKGDNGTRLDPDLFTFSLRMEYYMVGFVGSIVSGMVSLVLVPLAVAVLENHVMVFGGTTHNLFDDTFTVVLAFTYSIGYALCIAGLGRYYVGAFSRLAIENLVKGMATAAGITIFLAWIGYNWVAFQVLDPGRVADGLLKLRHFRNPERLHDTWNFLMSFRESLITSAVFITISKMLFILIPLASLFYYRRKFNARKVEEEF